MCKTYIGPPLFYVPCCFICYCVPWCFICQKRKCAVPHGSRFCTVGSHCHLVCAQCSLMCFQWMYIWWKHFYFIFNILILITYYMYYEHVLHCYTLFFWNTCNNPLAPQIFHICYNLIGLLDMWYFLWCWMHYFMMRLNTNGYDWFLFAGHRIWWLKWSP